MLGESVLGLAAVIERVFVADAAAIGEFPAGVLQELIDLDPGEGLVGHFWLAAALGRGRASWRDVWTFCIRDNARGSSCFVHGTVNERLVNGFG